MDVVLQAVGDGITTAPLGAVLTGTGAASSLGLLRKFSGMPNEAAFLLICAEGETAIGPKPGDIGIGDRGTGATRRCAGSAVGTAAVYGGCGDASTGLDGITAGVTGDQTSEGAYGDISIGDAIGDIGASPPVGNSSAVAPAACTRARLAFADMATNRFSVH